MSAEEGAPRRLSKEARRAQLLAAGRRLVEDRAAFESLSTDEVAEVIGISRSLLFHYFPTREDFLLALAADAAEELLAVLDTDAALPPAERLGAALDRFVAYVETYPTTYVALVRGAAGGSSGMQELFARTRGVLADRILEGLGLEATSSPAPLRLAARGYVAAVEEVVVTWLRSGRTRMERPELLAYLRDTGLGMLATAARHADRSGVAGLADG